MIAALVILILAQDTRASGWDIEVYRPWAERNCAKSYDPAACVESALIGRRGQRDVSDCRIETAKIQPPAFAGDENFELHVRRRCAVRINRCRADWNEAFARLNSRSDADMDRARRLIAQDSAVTPPDREDAAAFYCGKEVLVGELTEVPAAK